MNTLKIFCHNLARRRNELGLTQQAVADKLGVTWNTYVAYEYAYKKGGKPWPRPERIDEFAKILKCKPVDFFKEL